MSEKVADDWIVTGDLWDRKQLHVFTANLINVLGSELRYNVSIELAKNCRYYNSSLVIYNYRAILRLATGERKLPPVMFSSN